MREKIGRAELAVPPGVDEDARAGRQEGFERLQILRSDLTVGGLGQVEAAGRTVKPVERHLVERTAVIEKVIHGVKMRSLVGTDQDVRGVELTRRDASVRDDRELWIIGKRRRSVHERVSQIDQTRCSGGIWGRMRQDPEGNRASNTRL